MWHEPAASSGPDHAIGYKTKLGVWLFLPYSLIYAVFVLVNVLDAKVMEKTVLFGLNLAVVFGFGLILFALVLALIYNSLCSKRERAGAAAAGVRKENA